VNFPARWHDADFNGVLPRGTPVAQCIPVRRELWAGRFETMSREWIEKLSHTTDRLTRETGVYRRNFRAPKR
jgi:hypothetical protein